MLRLVQSHSCICSSQSHRVWYPRTFALTRLVHLSPPCGQNTRTGALLVYNNELASAAKEPWIFSKVRCSSMGGPGKYLGNSNLKQVPETDPPHVHKRRYMAVTFFWIQHLYSATSKLVLRRREPQWGPMSEVCLQEAYVRCGQSLIVER